MKLRTWRLNEGLTQPQLAERIGVTVSTISRYELGRVPEPDVIKRIYAETNGKVAPSDFYDLPSLEKRLPPSERRGTDAA